MGLEITNPPGNDAMLSAMIVVFVSVVIAWLSILCREPQAVHTVFASGTTRSSNTFSLPSLLLACRRTTGSQCFSCHSEAPNKWCQFLLTASAHDSPNRRTFLFKLCSCDLTTGPCIAPPPLSCTTDKVSWQNLSKEKA